MRGKKTGRVNDLGLVRFPWQRKGVFGQILLKKRLKMTKRFNACQSFRITTKALKLLGIVCRFMYFSRK